MLIGLQAFHTRMEDLHQKITTRIMKNTNQLREMENKSQRAMARREMVKVDLLSQAEALPNQEVAHLNQEDLQSQVASLRTKNISQRMEPLTTSQRTPPTRSISQRMVLMKNISQRMPATRNISHRMVKVKRTEVEAEAERAHTTRNKRNIHMRNMKKHMKKPKLHQKKRRRKKRKKKRSMKRKKKRRRTKKKSTKKKRRMKKWLCDECFMLTLLY